MQPFGHTPAGQPAHLHTLTLGREVAIEISDLGATIVRWWVPDRTGAVADIVLGCDTAEGYARQTAYFGAVIGRYANRIANGQFVLAGEPFNLARNNQPGGIPCHLHGGLEGFDKKIWRVIRRGPHFLHLAHHSPDGEGGYPGNLEVGVEYTLTGANELRLDYTATTDRATPINLTNHSYFNLAGEGADTVLDHRVTLAASQFTPVNAGLIPTGEIMPVAGTPFDFRSPRRLGERIDVDDKQLRYAGGYDHNFVLDEARGQLARAATVNHDASGRWLEVHTTEPGLQLYSGNFLSKTTVGKAGRPCHWRSGLCLETQHFPDSPNQPAFPSTILEPGTTFRSTTIYRFGTE
jgi:aldose 1-epimerase